MPIEEMTKEIAMPGGFLRFIGVVEVLGAIGLILPWLLRIRPNLTPLAAAGLVIIMIGATVVTLDERRYRNGADPIRGRTLCRLRRLWPMAADTASRQILRRSQQRRSRLTACPR